MIIATRILKLHGDKTDVEIPIRIFAPERKGDAWSCRYEIDWPEGREMMTSWGVDSVQSIVVALQMIGSDLYTSSYHKSGKLMFEALGRGYGFPVPNSLRELLVGDDATYGA